MADASASLAVTYLGLETNQSMSRAMLHNSQRTLGGIYRYHFMQNTVTDME